MGKPIGITKPEYFAILNRAGQKLGMTFPLVLMESCHGTFADGQHCGLPTNVDKLFSSGDRYTHYATLNYDDLFRSVDKTHSFADALTNSFRRDIWRCTTLEITSMLIRPKGNAALDYNADHRHLWAHTTGSGGGRS
jgi:hypothetical protein